MHVIWKRPDGLHSATPDDYRVVDVAGKSRIWLHKTDHENFPFRVSGGWKDEALTQRLNRLVNLLALPLAEMRAGVLAAYQHSDDENLAAYVGKTCAWLDELRGCLKGDTWEVEIMGQTLAELAEQIRATPEA